MTTPVLARNKAISTLELALTNAVDVDKGYIACIDTGTGKFTVAGTSTTLLPVGRFTEATTGDGTTTTCVELFEEVRAQWFANYGSGPVLSSHIGSECYLYDYKTVTITSTGRSKAGRVLAVDSTYGVLVQTGVAVTGPTGASLSPVGSVADRTALAAIAAANRADGTLVLDLSDGSLWRFDADSTLQDDEAQEFCVEPAAGAGCWIRADKTFVAKIPVDYTMADGATILTVPTGFTLRLAGLPFWSVTTGWTGGSSSTIGIAASTSGLTAAGAVLGGASGDATATLGTTGYKAGTIGSGLDTLAKIQAALIQAADTLTYEEITSAYTAGEGFVCIPVAVIAP